MMCAACRQGQHTTRCPICTVELCAKCSLIHDAERVSNPYGSLCLQIEAFASMYAAMRRETDEERFLLPGWQVPADVWTPEPEDWARARRAYAYDMRRYAQC